jgi:hypothetical protein
MNRLYSSATAEATAVESSAKIWLNEGMLNGRIIVLLCGLHSAAFGIFHLLFWRIFRWKADLRGHSDSSRAIIQILNLRIIYVFFAVAALCFAFPSELIGTALGRAVLGGMALFWVGRTIEQFVFLRGGGVFVHALTAAIVLGAVLFAAPLFVGA